MRIFAKLGCLYFDGAQHKSPMPSIKVVDLYTGNELRWCRLADDVTGEYERFVSRPQPLRSKSWLTEPAKNVGVPRLVKGQSLLRIEFAPCPDPSCPICRRIIDVRA